MVLAACVGGVRVRVLRFVLPLPKNIANGSHGHWRARHREKLLYWADLDLALACNCNKGWRHVTDYRLPPPPYEPFAKASIRSRMYLGAAMDDSNAMRRHKWIEDWLKTRGYIKDDRRSCLKWEGFPEQVIRRDGNYRVEITLTNVA